MNTNSDTADLKVLLSLSDLEALPDPKARGKTCVWCPATLNTETAVDLGARRITLGNGAITIFPRSCRPCVATHAHRTLLRHAPTCESCVDNAAECDTGRTLYRLVRDHRR